MNTRKIREKAPVSAPVSQSGQTGSLKSVHTKRPYSNSPDSQFLTQAELTAVFRVIKSPRDRAIFRIVVHRGLRSGEVCRLMLSDYNHRENRLFIRREKGSESREYQLLDEETRALKAWLKIRGPEPGPLFPSRQKRAGGLGIHRSQLDRLFRRYCAAANLRPEKRHMHVLKHTTGTLLSEMGNPVEVIKDWLGHVSQKSCERYYIHFSQRRRDEAYERNRAWK